jgi:drug/metabolite transporter (DMT)-like permease
MERGHAIKDGPKIFAITPVLLLLGISYLERVKDSSSSFFAWAILLVVFVSVVCSQSCARYVARTKSTTWSQPRLTSLNAIFLGVVLSIALGAAKIRLLATINIALCLAVGAMILLIQRLYVYGLKRADPFVSAVTICTIVPFSLGAEMIFEHKRADMVEIILATAYTISAIAVGTWTRHKSQAIRNAVA